MLHAMIRNLIDNAVRYNQDRGSLEVLMSHDERQVFMTVSDTGPGIAEADRIKVFDRFHRLSQQEGTRSGLGLSIVNRIVELHRGTIRLDDSLSGGASFSVSLPREKSE